MQMAEPMLTNSVSMPADAIDYSIMRGAQAVGDATDIYGFALPSPFLNPKNKKNDSSDDDKSSQNSQKSSHSQEIKIVQEEELLGECHIGFEKLLPSLFQF